MLLRIFHERRPNEYLVINHHSLYIDIGVKAYHTNYGNKSPLKNNKVLQDFSEKIKRK